MSMETKQIQWGYYLKPLQWLGELPSDDMGETIDGAKATGVFFSHVISNQNYEIKAHVCRDGLFLFEFTKILFRGKAEYGPFTRNTENLTLPIMRILNSHLACLWTVTNLFLPRPSDEETNFSLDLLSLGKDDLWYFDKEDGSSSSFAFPKESELFYKRSTIGQNVYTLADELLGGNSLFLVRGKHHIPLKFISSSFENFEYVLDYKNPERAVVLWELLSKALQSNSNYDFDWALMTAWAAIESLIADLWGEFLITNEMRRNEKGEDYTFIDNVRRNRLNDNRTYSSAVKLEILSWANILNIETYHQLQRLRKMRNDWIHSLKHITDQDATLAIRTLASLLYAIHIFPHQSV